MFSRAPAAGIAIQLSTSGGLDAAPSSHAERANSQQPADEGWPRPFPHLPLTTCSFSRVEGGRGNDSDLAPVPNPRSSNRTCGFPASASPTAFTAGLAAQPQDAPHAAATPPASRRSPRSPGGACRAWAHDAAVAGSGVRALPYGAFSIPIQGYVESFTYINFPSLMR